MTRRRDSEERRAALAASEDLARIKAAARRARLSVRRQRYRVGAQIVYLVQERGTPYREWGQHGALFFDEDGTFSGGMLFGTYLPVRTAAAALVEFGMEHGGLPGSTYERRAPASPTPHAELAVEPEHIEPYLYALPPAPAEPRTGWLRRLWRRLPAIARRRTRATPIVWPPTWAETQARERLAA